MLLLINLYRVYRHILSNHRLLCLDTRMPKKLMKPLQVLEVEEAKTAKYLGVTIQNDLNWNKHIDATTKKANNTRAFLQRNIKQCPGKTKERCYKTLVRPILEYASVIWDPFTDDNIPKLEMVLRRSACTVFSDY